MSIETCFFGSEKLLMYALDANERDWGQSGSHGTAWRRDSPAHALACVAEHPAERPLARPDEARVERPGPCVDS